ncbi:hypothetical protein BKA69DRAFT_1128390 [Paraphysoderma sedebokerense]|nr:hypothetical protein BKA69DRAFT_1128390 [Paraphysoderma sedebokerense]
MPSTGDIITLPQNGEGSHFLNENMKDISNSNNKNQTALVKESPMSRPKTTGATMNGTVSSTKAPNITATIITGTRPRASPSRPNPNDTPSSTRKRHRASPSNSSSNIASKRVKPSAVIQVTTCMRANGMSFEPFDDDDLIMGKRQRGKNTRVPMEDPDGIKSGSFSPDELRLFIDGFNTFGRDWKRIQEHMGGNRDIKSIKSHAQKHFIKLFRDNIPLPAIVLKTGKGYTLSGRPLNPKSSACKPYLQHLPQFKHIYENELSASNSSTVSIDSGLNETESNNGSIVGEGDEEEVDELEGEGDESELGNEVGEGYEDINEIDSDSDEMDDTRYSSPSISMVSSGISSVV